MARLIDLDEIKPMFFPSTEMDGLDVVRYLNTLPTVDAVEVVRCKDCKWYNRNEDIMPQSGSCEFHEMVKMDWDFCSRAKMDGDGNGKLD